MSDEQYVRYIIPYAQLYGHSHGKVRVESPKAGVLGEMAYIGTRERRSAEAWRSAAEHVRANLDVTA